MTQSSRETLEEEASSGGPHKFFCLLAGLAVFCLIRFAVPLPDGMSPDGLKVAAVLALMLVWWLTEAVPLPVTALLPLVLFPTLGVMNMNTAASSYADPVIFLYLGGFMLAIAMERWGLHLRIALHIVRVVGSSANLVIAGFMLATAFLSMWISNTATVMMMLPIGTSVIYLLMHRDGEEPHEGAHNFATCMMLGLAYAASIGGIGTLIGTAPNAIFAGYMRNFYGIEIGFAQWMVVAVPVAAMMLFICWQVLVRLYPNRMGRIEGVEQVIGDELRKLGRWSRGEVLIAVIFGATAMAWMFRPAINLALPGLALTDAGIAIISGMLLFIVPVSLKRGQVLLTWKEAERLPWGVLLLFGGGLCLASAVRNSHLAEWVGLQIQAAVDVAVFPLILIVSGLVLLMTEFMSNVATVTTMLPVIAALAAAFGYAPIELMLPATLMASFAFMMPVATPPNAIVFASGHIRIRQMAYAGLWLNLFAIALVPAFCYWVIGYVGLK